MSLLLQYSTRRILPYVSKKIRGIASSREASRDLEVNDDFSCNWLLLTTQKKIFGFHIAWFIEIYI